MAETKTRRRGWVRALEGRLEEAGGEVMKAWRTQARRRDPVGDVSYRGLQMVHGGVRAAARSLGRLEEATVPPHRAVRPEPEPEPPPQPPTRHRPAARSHRPATGAS